MSNENKVNQGEPSLYERKWLINYAMNGLSFCKDPRCLAESKKIAKDEIRIGRRYPSPYQDDAIAVNWFHLRCMFSQQKRARAGTQIIEKPEDMDGFDELLLNDRLFVNELIEGNVELPQDKENNKLLPESQTPAKRPRLSSTPMKKTDGKILNTPSTGRRDNGRIVML